MVLPRAKRNTGKNSTMPKTNTLTDTIPSMPRGGKREGSGRKLKYDESMTSRTFSLPVSLDESIQDKADKNDMSWSETVITALKSKFQSLTKG